MSSVNQGNGGPITYTAEQMDEARAEAHTRGVSEGTKAGGVAAVASERSRIKAIVTHAEAEGRPSGNSAWAKAAIGVRATTQTTSIPAA